MITKRFYCDPFCKFMLCWIVAIVLLVLAFAFLLSSTTKLDERVTPPFITMNGGLYKLIGTSEEKPVKKLEDGK